VAGGDKNVHYVNGTDLFRFASPKIAVDPAGIINPTVGGCHPSDLGMKAVSDYYTTFLPTLLDQLDHTEQTDSSSDEQLTSLLAAATATATAGDVASNVFYGGGDAPDGRPATDAEQQAHHDIVVQSMGPVDMSQGESAPSATIHPDLYN
jgi:hypothetical protein